MADLRVGKLERQDSAPAPLKKMEEAATGVSLTLDTMRRMAASLDKLSEVQKAAGDMLLEAFEDYALSKDLEEDVRVVAELFVAWREVGEAQATLAGHMRSLGESLRGHAAQGESEAKQRCREAERLHQQLVEDCAPRGGGMLSWMFRSAPPPEEEAAEQKRIEGHKAAFSVCVEHITENMAAIREQSRASLATSVSEARRHAKAVGEKLTILRPSWRGCTVTKQKTAPPSSDTWLPWGGGSEVKSEAPPTRSLPARAKPVEVPGGRKVDQMIRTMATAESRQKALDVEEAKQAARLAKQGNSNVVGEVAPMMAPPVDVLGESEWRIKGVYDHQVLKAGLRRLEEAWRLEGVGEFPRGKDGGAVMLREGLLRDLLSGKIRLQSVPNNDVAAAQSDVKRLSLPQLLKLRVLHLDFTPSGCGADTVHAVGGTQEAFLGLLDGLLFQGLGQKATEALSGGAADLAAERHRLGREAVLLYAAGCAVQASRWWCWWLTDERRVYFDALSFKSSSSFADAKGGVLEVTDLSKADRHNPSGRLRWMDWRVNLISEEAKLAPEPQRGQRWQGAKDAGANPTAPPGPSPSSSPPPPTGGASPPSAPDDSPQEEALSGAANAATAGMVSPELLKDLKGSLRKTKSSTLGAGQPAGSTPEGSDAKPTTPRGSRPATLSEVKLRSTKA